jgi:hypothetical protein
MERQELRCQVAGTRPSGKARAAWRIRPTLPGNRDRLQNRGADPLREMGTEWIPARYFTHLLGGVDVVQFERLPVCVDVPAPEEVGTPYCMYIQTQEHS